MGRLSHPWDKDYESVKMRTGPGTGSPFFKKPQACLTDLPESDAMHNAQSQIFIMTTPGLPEIVHNIPEQLHIHRFRRQCQALPFHLFLPERPVI